MIVSRPKYLDMFFKTSDPNMAFINGHECMKWLATVATV